MRATVDGANGAQGDHAQLVVICGKNHKLRDELRAVDWGPHLHVVVEGFTNRMSDYMAASDCIVTKAGPGTIAEACCAGLPIMLSGFLPGQESGNVGFVVDGGFGDYSAEPTTIAETVRAAPRAPRPAPRASPRPAPHAVAALTRRSPLRCTCRCAAGSMTMRSSS